MKAWVDKKDGSIIIELDSGKVVRLPKKEKPSSGVEEKEVDQT